MYLFCHQQKEDTWGGTVCLNPQVRGEVWGPYSERGQEVGTSWEVLRRVRNCFLLYLPSL